MPFHTVHGVLKARTLKWFAIPFSSEMWELDYKESWALKNWCFWTVVLEKILESPLDCKEIKAVNPKGNQSRIFIGRTDAEAEIPLLWPPDSKNWLIGKDPDSGKDWRQEKGMAEDEMVVWHHWLWWTWVWASSRSWWLTGKPAVLQSMGPQIVRHNWATELNWTEMSDYKSMLSPNFSHPPSPAVSISPFSMSASLYCPANGFISTIFLDPILDSLSLILCPAPGVKC